MNDNQDAAKVLKDLENSIRTNNALLKRSRETAAEMKSRLDKKEIRSAESNDAQKKQ